MSYTPLAGDAVSGDWIGAAAYTPLSGDAVSGDWLAVAIDAVVIRSAAPSPLGAAELRMVAQSALVSAPSPLGVIELRIVAHLGVWAAAPSPLGAAATLVVHDFTTKLGDGRTQYVMDLTTPDGVVRVPISSWQATLQAGAASYLQAVVPAAAEVVDALETATAFAILRRAVVPDGTAIEYEMAAMPVQTRTLDRGPYRSTMTLAGYAEAFAEGEESAAAFARVLHGVRSISTGPSGHRVRCAIDWLLRPGHRATVEGEQFTVAYINFYVNANDAYADVGERRV